MRTPTRLAVLILTSIVVAVAGPSWAQTQPPQATVPAAWAGIWQVNEETRVCSTGDLLGTSAYLDTLCAGDAFYVLPGSFIDQSGPHYASCSGPGFSDTELDLTCSANNVACLGSSNIITTNVAHWSRNGDEATTLLTHTVTYGALCGGSTSCQRTTGTRTRIGDLCGATPVRSQSWGTLKLLYR